MAVVKENLYVPERIKKLRDLVFNSPWEFDIDRMKYYTDSYKKTEGQMPAVRAARGLEEMLGRMDIRIDDGETIVGSKSSKRLGAVIYIESGVDPYLPLVLRHYESGVPLEQTYPQGYFGVSADYLKTLSQITEEEYRAITGEILPYWRGKSSNWRLRERMKQLGVPEDATAEFFNGDPEHSEPPGVITGHISVGVEKAIKLGMKGIARQAAERLAQLDPNEANYQKKKDFLEGVQVANNAVCMWAGRYAKLAEEMAATADPQRRVELLAIAERCRWVPGEPPRTFLEAIQTIFLTQAAVIISYGDWSITCPGRVDQYLYPFYKQDLEAGRITRDQALEAIMEYYIKVAYNFNGPNDMTIGGLDRSGRDATNEVSYLFLEAHRNLKGLRNGIGARISDQTPRSFLRAACEVNRHTAGVAFYNDAITIRDLVENDGYSLEDARDWSNIGCTEVTGSANNNGNTAAHGSFLVALLEMALNEGCWSLFKWRRIGVPTPPASSFKSFEDVKQAFVDQLAHFIETSVRRVQLKEEVVAEYYPQPLLSSTIEGCIESATDFTSGGAKYNSASIGAQAMATLADSLAAIKSAVFDKKLLTMEELVRHLRNNFEGAEELRQQLLGAPKFGNDDPYVDELAVWVAEVYNKELKRHPYWLGGPHRGCMISSMTQTLEGRLCGASADGRQAGLPVSNGMSPTNGMERSGMTAAMCSAATASIVQLSDSTSFNINLNPMTIKTDEGLEKMVSSIEAYFAMGGRQLQFNPVTRAMLLDAQQNPSNYPELMVKVSGFSFRFIDLPKSLQDDIVNRTEFNAC